MVTFFGIRAHAQDAPAVHVGTGTITGVPDDWTHHHLIFTDPGTEQDAVRNGTHEQWMKVVNDPRYVLQQMKRNLSVQGPAAQDVEMRRRLLGNPQSATPQGLNPQYSSPLSLSPQRPGEPVDSGNPGVLQIPDRWGGPIQRGPGGIRNPNPLPALPSLAPMQRDWSMNVGGNAGSLTLTVAAPGAGNISGSSVLTVDGVGFDASAPTTASVTGTFTGNPTNGQQVTVGAQAFTASLSTAASRTGTFSSSPLSSTAITVVNGANTLTLQTNGTAASVVGTALGTVPAANTQMSVTVGANTVTLSNGGTTASAIGTVSAVPTSTTAPTITITNGVNANVLSLTTNATAAHATGTFSGTGPTATQTITITNGLNANVLIMTAGAGGTGTITVSGQPSTASTLTIGGQGYTFATSCGTAAFCIERPNGGSNTQYAFNIAAAITANNALCTSGTGGTCYGTNTTAIADVTATAATSGGNGVVTVTNYTGATIAWSETSGALALSASPIPVGTANACGSSTAGTFLINPTDGTGAAVATNFTTALSACSATVGVTTSRTGAVVTITDRTLGAYPTLTLAEGATNFVWSGVTTGTAGTNGCSNATTGTFAVAASNTNPNNQIASNLSAAINSCVGSFAAVGVTGAYTSGATFTVTNATPGPFLTVGGTNLAGVYSWGAVSGGAAGTSTCSSATTGTYATSATAATLASNINTAINACNTSFPAVGATSAYTSGSTFTVSNTTPGTFVTLSTAAANNAGIFSWGSVTAGTNGSNTCPSSTTGTFATDSNTTNLATNLSAAINLCPTGTGLTTTSTHSGATVTITATKWGMSGNAIGLTPTSGFFTWPSGALTGGLDGTNTGTSFAIDNVLADNATSLAAAINRYSGTLGVTAASATADVTVSAVAPGTTANGTVAVANALANYSWAGGSLAGGTNGTAGTTQFTYWTGSTYVSNTQLATNIAAALNSNSTVNAVLTATPNSPANGNLLLQAVAYGTGGNGIAASQTAFTAITGTGSTTGGSAGAQAGQSPAKYSFSVSDTVTAANCATDYIVYPTNGLGSSTQATITAYNNMYKTTCSGSVPSIYWSYNTGGTASLSPVLSNDGTQVAYVQTAGGTASLVLLKMANSGSSVVTPTLATVANYHSCAAPCYTTVSLGAGDTNSAPFYDYGGDFVYVGDNNGRLHKIQYVFFAGPGGAGPIEATSWPVSVTATAGLKALTSPVLDTVTGNVYIGEGYTSGNNPLMMQVNVTTRVVTPSLTLGLTGVNGLGPAPLDAPIVDSSAARLYAFSGSDGRSFFTGGTCGTFQACTAVYQIPTGSSFGTATPVEAKVGIGTTGSNIYAGTFDNTYFNSANPSLPTGNLLVCGTTTGTAQRPALFSIAIGSNSMGTVSAGLSLTNANAICSPITEVANGATDWAFLSVTAAGNRTGCTGACVYSFNVTSGVPANSTAGLPAVGGAGSIAIDNISSSPGASQIYFTTLGAQSCTGNGTNGNGTGACAIQASQTGLN